MRPRRGFFGNPKLRSRRGYGLFELAIAIFLLSVVLGVMVKVVNGVGIERRAADRRLFAIQEASNLMERLTSEPFDTLSNERAKVISEGSLPKKSLPDASWQIDVSELKGGPLPAKRLSVRLRWKDRSQGWDSPVSLTSWVYLRRKP